MDHLRNLIQISICAMYELCTTSGELKFILVSCNPILTSFVFNKTCMRNIKVPNFIPASRPWDRNFVILGRRDRTTQLLPFLRAMTLKPLTPLRRFQLPNRLFIIHARNILPPTIQTKREFVNPNTNPTFRFIIFRPSPIPPLFHHGRIVLPDLKVLRHRPILTHNPDLHHLFWRRRRRGERRTTIPRRIRRGRVGLRRVNKGGDVEEFVEVRGDGDRGGSGGGGEEEELVAVANIGPVLAKEEEGDAEEEKDGDLDAEWCLD
uniref:Uncharacterized protein n=2 Tax=Opuntia streptacantha TaxID=393608 RepID=A0A7C9EU71_OPUST